MHQTGPERGCKGSWESTDGYHLQAVVQANHHRVAELAIHTRRSDLLQEGLQLQIHIVMPIIRETDLEVGAPINRSLQSVRDHHSSDRTPSRHSLYILVILIVISKLEKHTVRIRVVEEDSRKRK